MKISTPHKLVALVFVLTLVAAACGQKEGVHVAAGQATANQQDFQATTDGGGAGGSAVDDLGETTSGGANGADTRTVTRTVGGEGGGGGGSTGGGGGDGGGGGGLTAQGSDRTGVTDSKITLAIHAPVTGAAPLPTTSFENLRDLYWRHVIDTQGETVLGRSEVEVLFRDDKYSPSSARQVCRELGQQSFLLVGGGGTDQIQACADFSNASQIPYLSAGVTERGIAGLDWYFATSMSYKAQGDLLGQYVAKNFPDKRAAMIVTDTPNFDDAVEGWEAAVDRYGIDYYKTLTHPKQDQSWYNSFGSELQSNGVEVVYMLTAPVDYIQFAQQNSDGDNPGFQYVGVGITMGLNAILPTGCPDVNGGIYFSPFPGLDWARDNVPEYFDAAADYGGGTEADDLGLALWSIAEAQHEMFKRYGQTFGNDLTREDFRALTEQQQGIQGKVGPELNYTPDDHFGANQVHVLQANCEIEEHETLATFKSSF